MTQSRTVSAFVRAACWNLARRSSTALLILVVVAAWPRRRSRARPAAHSDRPRRADRSCRPVSRGNLRADGRRRTAQKHRTDGTDYTPTLPGMSADAAPCVGRWGYCAATDAAKTIFHCFALLRDGTVVSAPQKPVGRPT